MPKRAEQVELRVKNLGIIEDMDWRLGNGLNIITGKADHEVIRHGADEAQIERVFTLPQNENLSSLRDLLVQKDLTSDEETLIIEYKPRRKGSGVIRVNGHAVPKTLLRQIGRLLVDIHGQSEHLSLLDTKSHLDFLDSYAHTLDTRRSFSIKAVELYKIEQELENLDRDEQERARREEFLRFQIEEIDRAQLREGEEEELGIERNILASAEKLKSISCDIYRALCEEDASHHSAAALDRLNEAAHAMKKLVELDPTQSRRLELVEGTIYSLTEVARDIRAYGDSLEYAPGRLEEIESRLELIRNLKRKYGQTIAGVINYLAKAQQELDDVSNSAERRAKLADKSASLRQEMGQIAYQLFKQRSKAAKQLASEVKKELDDLNMSQVEFEVSVSQQQAEEGIPFPDGDSYAFSNEGADTVEFMASTNPGEPFKPLARIASTGEISRLTLALKGALSQADSIPVLIFDEIDIGVGGRSGEIIGKKLSTLARNHQVVCVTHLPQIAAFADTHFSVHKEIAGTRTLSRLEHLDGGACITELAIMLAGAQYTEASLNSARELLRKTEIWKNSNPI